MERMRTIAGLALVASLALLPPVIEAAFSGTLVAEVAATVDITPATTFTGDAAVTISYLNRRGSKVRDIDIATISSGTAMMTIPLTITKNTGRIYIELDRANPDLAQIRVTQGPDVITHDVDADGRMVLDVVQAP